LLVLLTSWGFLGLTLYLLINMGTKESSKVAKKTFIIVGGTDALMLLGIALIYSLAGTFQIDQVSISLASGYQPLLANAAYLCLAIACFAKAGAMPFHTWIPECAQEAPLPVVAYLPAALDKLLGIYLLARISLNMFVMNPAMNTMLMFIGAFTIVAGVMMALVQHNMKRLLGYHAVSQVGYMILGIGTGNPIGIAGGLFHMLNNAVYKSSLFLVAGNVEYRAKTTELDDLGGLAKTMPITFLCCLVASLSISGVPLFNGFVSKWMIYQGIILGITKSPSHQVTSVVCLVAAMFGSGLTLASFMKLIHAAFLAQPKNQRIEELKNNEVSWSMWLPCAILAVICIIFGIFANQLPLKYFIFPAVPGVSFNGAWGAGLSALLVLAGLALGLIVFGSKWLRPTFREDKPFIGAETVELKEGQARVSGTEFYNTIKEYGILKAIYKKAEAGVFDIYQQGKKILTLSNFLKFLHNGILPTYLVWVLLGMFFVFLVLR
ncbi:MAG: proton-conducting transporter membrane subunit, partial [Candidatus Omnitrophica bacterium]|nr:proton-conducting transporter membrane subunit [Candidatus Omnitrophota bacterium]